jgi:hypothetical protein
MCPHARELFDNDRVEDEIGIGASELGRGARSQESRRAHFAPALAIAHPYAVPSVDFRYDLAFDEAAHLRPEHLVFFDEKVASHVGFRLGANPCTEARLFQTARGGRTPGFVQRKALALNRSSPPLNLEVTENA